ncbi:MAG: nucleoside 2-deoxyribosyltransferase [Leptospira sp.]|nr:nucleoside 2-deoxyribosyltransferase [Leptospira sp.]
MKIYLAGPEVFLPNAHEVLGHHKELCKKYGFTGLSPFDSVLEGKDLKGMDLARGIYLANAKLIKECDILIANCVSFRGPLVDDGTAWEIGYAFALGKKIYGFIDKYIPVNENVAQRVPTKQHESGFLIDGDGYLLNEDFGNAVNLMLEFSIEESGGKFIEGGFEDILKLLSAQP